MHTLVEHYFKDAAFERQNRELFALASYNAGPGRIEGLRRRAEKEGLDPNRWFGHVERIAAQRVSRETVHFVRNVYKYYIGYTFRLEAIAARKAAAKKVELGVRR
jgi:membrane-bound lytic murein transglycosylase MltF